MLTELGHGDHPNSLGCIAVPACLLTPPPPLPRATYRGL